MNKKCNQQTKFLRNEPPLTAIWKCDHPLCRIYRCQCEGKFANFAAPPKPRRNTASQKCPQAGGQFPETRRPLDGIISHGERTDPLIAVVAEKNCGEILACAAERFHKNQPIPLADGRPKQKQINGTVAQALASSGKIIGDLHSKSFPPKLFGQ
jgi:hypothetical protein